MWGSVKTSVYLLHYFIFIGSLLFYWLFYCLSVVLFYCLLVILLSIHFIALFFISCLILDANLFNLYISLDIHMDSPPLNPTTQLTTELTSTTPGPLFYLSLYFMLLFLHNIHFIRYRYGHAPQSVG